MQATLIAVDPDTVGLEITLAPGVEIAQALISRMDTNRDGAISSSEARDFGLDSYGGSCKAFRSRVSDSEMVMARPDG